MRASTSTTSTLPVKSKAQIKCATTQRFVVQSRLHSLQPYSSNTLNQLARSQLTRRSVYGFRTSTPVVFNSTAQEDVASSSSDTAAPAYTTHKWKWQGHTVNYATAGCGKPVLLVHGFGASVGHFKRNIPAIAKTHKVYALDLLGFGATDKPIVDYSMELWEQQILDFVNEFMGGQEVVIVGNSIGSLATLMACKSLQDRVGGCVLLNCAGGMNNKAISDDWRIKLFMPLFLLIDFLLKQEGIAKSLFDKYRTPDNIKNILTSVYPSNPAHVDDDLVEMLYGPSCDEGALEAFVSIITGPPGPRPEDLVPHVQAPMLILWGDKDNFTPSSGPVGRYFQSLPEKFSNIRFHHLEGAGHCLHDEVPEEVHSYLLPWLQEVHA